MIKLIDEKTNTILNLDNAINAYSILLMYENIRILEYNEEIEKSKYFTRFKRCFCNNCKKAADFNCKKAIDNNGAEIGVYQCLVCKTYFYQDNGVYVTVSDNGFLGPLHSPRKIKNISDFEFK